METNKEVVKNSNKKIIIFFSVVLILLISAGVFFFFNMNSNKNKFLNLVNNKYNQMIEKIKNPKDNTFGIIKADQSFELGLDINFNVVANVKDEVLTNIFELLDKTSINIKLGDNPKTKESYLLLNSTYEGKEFISFNYYQNAAGEFILYPKTFDKYIKNEKTKVSTESISYEKNEYITKKIKDSFLGGLEESDFSYHVETITISGKNYNTEKLSLTLSEERIEKILTKVLNDMKNDKKINELLVGFDYKQYLKEMKKAIVLKDAIVFDLYIYKGDILQSELMSGKNKVIKYQTELDSSKQTINIYVENIPLFTLEFNKISDDNMTFNISSLGDFLSLNGAFNNKKEVITNNKSWKDNIDFSFKYKVMEEKIDLRMNVIMNTKTVKKIVLPVIKDYVLEKEMTEEEKNIISDYLLGKLMLITNEKQK